MSSINLATLKGGEGVKLRLDSKQTKKLFEGLKKLYAISREGVQNGEIEYGLKYQFLNQLTDQPSYGGVNFTGKGNQKGDYLLSTEANIKFTVLVEIKTPNTPLISIIKNGPKRYRNGA